MLRYSRRVMSLPVRRRAAVALAAAPSRFPLITAAATPVRRLHLSPRLRSPGKSPQATAAAAGAAASPKQPPAETEPQRPQQEETTAPSAAPTENPPSEKDVPAANDSGSGGAAAQSGATTVADMMAHPESAMRRLFASWQQGVVASIGAVMGIGFLLYFLYTPVKEDTVHHTAVVASEALADARLKGQAVQLSKDVVLEVLRDPKSLDAAADVVVLLLGREETKIAVSSLLQSLFEDHYTQEVTKKFVLQVVQDPWIQDQLQGITEDQVRRLLRNPDLKAALSDFLLRSAVDSLEKPQFHYEVARAVRHSAASVFNSWWS